MGLDGIKLFTVAFMGNKSVVNLDTPIVKAAVDVAHGQEKPAFAHPQNHVGADNALAGGVDVLGHTIPTEGSYTSDELLRMKQQHTGLIPTLTLWTTVVSDPVVADKLMESGVSELKAYFDEGGTILFGTDVGFQSKFDTTEEFEFMGRAMPWRDVLASILVCSSRRRPKAAWRRTWTQIWSCSMPIQQATCGIFPKLTTRSGRERSSTPGWPDHNSSIGEKSGAYRGCPTNRQG